MTGVRRMFFSLISVVTEITLRNGMDVKGEWGMRPDPHNGSPLVTLSEAARGTLGLFPVQRLLRSPLRAPQGERVWRSARIVRAAASEVAVYSGAFQACARARPRQRESRPVKEQ